MQTFEVIIVDDNLLEADEVFQLMLESLDTEDSDRIILQPNSTTIKILDNDSMNKFT